MLEDDQCGRLGGCDGYVCSSRSLLGAAVGGMQGRIDGLMWRLGKPLLVPLTTSLYVPGKLADPEHVIVDIGTGFYVEKVSSLDGGGVKVDE